MYAQIIVNSIFPLFLFFNNKYVPISNVYLRRFIYDIYIHDYVRALSRVGHFLSRLIPNHRKHIFWFVLNLIELASRYRGFHHANGISFFPMCDHFFLFFFFTRSLEQNLHGSVTILLHDLHNKQRISIGNISTRVYMSVIDENHVIGGMFIFFVCLFVFYTTSFHSKSFEKKSDREISNLV